MTLLNFTSLQGLEPQTPGLRVHIQLKLKLRATAVDGERIIITCGFELWMNYSVQIIQNQHEGKR